jgi:uncharacterized protein DUF4440
MVSVAVVVCLLIAVRPIAATPNAEDEITKLERGWLTAEANSDMPTLRRLIADEFMGTAFGPSVLTKADVVPSDGGGNRMPKSLLQESTVRVFGDTAVLMGSIVSEGTGAGGMRVTTVFQKRPQGWQIIATHMSRAVE